MRNHYFIPYEAQVISSVSSHSKLRLFRTTAVQIALRYAIVYAVLAGASLTAFYWATGQYVDSQLREGLEEDYQALRDRYKLSGLKGLTALMNARSESAVIEGRFYLLTDHAGRKLSGNLLNWPPEDPLPLDGRTHVVWVEDDIIPGNNYSDDAYWPVIGTVFPDGARLVVARSVQQAEELQNYSFYALFTLLAIVVLLALMMGVFMGSNILKRIDGITNTASEIMSGNLEQRMPVSINGDEFDELSERLNMMLDRIENLINGMREVTDNVAHDLRSPLTRMRNRLEVTLLEKRDEATYRQAMDLAIKDADTLVKTFNSILHISLAEAGTVRANMGPVDISTLVIEIGELYSPVAEEAGINFNVETKASILVHGNRNLIAQAVGNLLDNSIKYTSTGSNIRLGVTARDNEADITVIDDGPGIPQDKHERVIERFVRLDNARQTEGNGLGLSLVNAIVRQHGGKLILTDGSPGLIVTICLPLLRST